MALSPCQRLLDDVTATLAVQWVSGLRFGAEGRQIETSPQASLRPLLH